MTPWNNLLLGALSFLLAYMVIRFVFALFRRHENPHDHTIALGIGSIICCVVLILVVVNL